VRQLINIGKEKKGYLLTTRSTSSARGNHHVRRASTTLFKTCGGARGSRSRFRPEVPGGERGRRLTANGRGRRRGGWASTFHAGPRSTRRTDPGPHVLFRRDGHPVPALDGAERRRSDRACAFERGKSPSSSRFSRTTPRGEKVHRARRSAPHTGDRTIRASCHLSTTKEITADEPHRRAGGGQVKKADRRGCARQRGHLREAEEKLRREAEGRDDARKAEIPQRARWACDGARAVALSPLIRKFRSSRIDQGGRADRRDEGQPSRKASSPVQREIGRLRSALETRDKKAEGSKEGDRKSPSGKIKDMAGSRSGTGPTPSSQSPDGAQGGGRSLTIIQGGVPGRAGAKKEARESGKPPPRRLTRQKKYRKTAGASSSGT